MVDRGIPRQHYQIVNDNDETIGEVTSGTMSPMLKQGIGLAYLKKGYWKADSEIFVIIRDKKVKAKVTNLPFYKKS
jgi:aminomethyltransferase